MIYNGNRADRNPIRFVIILTKSDDRVAGVFICLITSMITDRIGRHKVLLPINHNHYNVRENKCIPFFCKRAFNTKYWQSHCLRLQIDPFWKIPSLVG